MEILCRLTNAPASPKESKMRCDSYARDPNQMSSLTTKHPSPRVLSQIRFRGFRNGPLLHPRSSFIGLLAPKDCIMAERRSNSWRIGSQLQLRADASVGCCRSGFRPARLLRPVFEGLASPECSLRANEARMHTENKNVDQSQQVDTRVCNGFRRGWGVLILTWPGAVVHCLDA